MNRKKWSIAGPLVVALIGCGAKGHKEAAESETATPVEVAKAKSGPLAHIVTAEAILYPISQSAITSKISAPVRRFLVNRGDHVRQGQLVAELEARDLQAAASENKALFQQAQAQYQATTKGTLPEDKTKARADFESARQGLDAAKRLHDNRVQLVREGALAQKLADDAHVALVQAQSQFDTAQHHLQSVETVSNTEQVRIAQSQVDAAKARMNSADAQVSYAELRSPIDGIVADRPLNAGEIASSGSPLVTVVNISEIVARANLPLRDTGHLKPGQTATIIAPEGELIGKVTVVSPAVDPASTTIEVWIRARNTGDRLRPGVTAKVAIQAETIPDAVTIPANALLSSEEGENVVMVVGPDSVAHQRKVETGIHQQGAVQITEGLKGGESVVISGGVGLADKAKVEIETAAKAGEKTDKDPGEK